MRMPEVLPTGRNLHGFDPFRIPSAYAVQDGARQAERLLERYMSDSHPFPETIAMVLWGTDNLKTEGAPIAQALSLIGAAPVSIVMVAWRAHNCFLSTNSHIRASTS